MGFKDFKVQALRASGFKGLGPKGTGFKGLRV